MERKGCCLNVLLAIQNREVTYAVRMHKTEIFQDTLRFPYFCWKYPSSDHLSSWVFLSPDTSLSHYTWWWPIWVFSARFPHHQVPFFLFIFTKILARRSEGGAQSPQLRWKPHFLLVSLWCLLALKFEHSTVFRRDTEFCKERLSLVKSDTFPLWVITNSENSSLG